MTLPKARPMPLQDSGLTAKVPLNITWYGTEFRGK